MNGLNQYTSAGSAAFTYDLNGNLTADGTNAYTYDIENRLVKAVSGGATTNLVYDPLGRLWQAVRGSADTRFIYDGDALVTEYDAAGNIAARYAHGPNAGADDPLIWYVGASGFKRYLHADHLGSIVAATNGTGAPSINTYDEYGVPQTDAATHTINLNAGRFQYTGQAFIPELGAGMYYYKARMYSAFLGRFLQTDPIGYEGGINVYAYVGNDPVNAVDPTGLQWFGAANLVERVVDEVKKDPVGTGILVAGIVIDLLDTPVSPGPDASIAGAAIKADRALEAAKATSRQETGIVYKRTNPETGRCYIGRCNSEELYARRQRDHDRQLRTRHEYEIRERAKPGPDLRKAEQRQIDAHGGPTNKSNPNGGTENKRNEIGFCRGTRIGNSETGSIC